MIEGGVSLDQITAPRITAWLEAEEKEREEIIFLAALGQDADFGDNRNVTALRVIRLRMHVEHISKEIIQKVVAGLAHLASLQLNVWDESDNLRAYLALRKAGATDPQITPGRIRAWRDEGNFWARGGDKAIPFL